MANYVVKVRIPTLKLSLLYSTISLYVDNKALQMNHKCLYFKYNTELDRARPEKKEGGQVPPLPPWLCPWTATIMWARFYYQNLTATNDT